MNFPSNICRIDKPLMTPRLITNNQQFQNQADQNQKCFQFRTPNQNHSYHVSGDQSSVKKSFQITGLTLQKIFENQNQHVDIQNIKYIVLKQIGQGNFGQVYLLNKQNSNSYYALKVQKQMNKEEQKILLELQGIKFKNLVNTIECLLNYQTQEYFILMEYCEQSLEDVLHKEKINQQDARYIIKQIANGIKELHDKQIIHRDLKPENILVFSYIDGENTQKTYKICDFGLSSTKQISQTYKCGTSHYMAPEQIQCLSDKNMGYQASVDIWALGAVIYEVFSGEVLFMENSNEEVFKLILSYKQEQIDEKIKNKLGNLEYVNLVLQMMQIDPNKRILINEVINKLKINGTKRINQEKSLHPIQNYYFSQIKINQKSANNLLSLSQSQQQQSSFIQSQSQQSSFIQSQSQSQQSQQQQSSFIQSQSKSQQSSFIQSQSQQQKSPFISSQQQQSQQQQSSSIQQQQQQQQQSSFIQSQSQQSQQQQSSSIQSQQQQSQQQSQQQQQQQQQSSEKTQKQQLFQQSQKNQEQTKIVFATPNQKYQKNIQFL